MFGKAGKKRQKLFFGWWIAIVTSIITGVAMVFFSQGASVFFKPIAADLNLNREAASMAVGIAALLNGLIFPVTGWLADRFGPRWIIIGGASLMGIGVILLRFVTSALTYYIVWGIIIGAGFNLAFTIAMDAMLTNWFVRKRGLAFSIRFGILSVAGIALLPVLGWLIKIQDWRMVMLIWGALLLACVPLLFFFTRQKRPEHYGLMPDGATQHSDTEPTQDTMIARGQQYASGIQETEYTLKQALKTFTYWMINIGWVVQAIVVTGFNLHVVPFLTDRGIDPLVASSLLAMMLFFTMPSRFFGSLFADRVKKKYLRFLVAGALFLVSAGITIFLLRPSTVAVYVLLALYGLGYGAYTPLDILLRGRYFGRKAYGSIQGLSVIISAPLAFVAPIYMGWIYDTTQTYNTAFIVFAVLAAVGGIALLLAFVPKSPAGDSA